MVRKLTFCTAAGATMSSRKAVDSSRPRAFFAIPLGNRPVPAGAIGWTQPTADIR